MYKILLCMAPVLLSPAFAQDKAPAPVAAAGPQPIPLTQIAVRNEDLSRTLREISRRLPADQDLAAFEQNFREQEDLVRKRIRESENHLTAGATLLEIREQLREWRGYAAVEAEQRKVLNNWGTRCEQNLTLLKGEQLVWETTLKTVRNLPKLRPLVSNIQAAIADIQGVKAVAEQRLRRVLDFQSRVAKQAPVIAEITGKLDAARQEFQARIFYPDAPPIWQAAPQRPLEPLTLVLSRSVDRFRNDAIAFAKVEKGMLIRAAILLIVVLAISWKVRLAMPRTQVDEAVAQAALVLRRPFSLTALIAAPVVALSSPPARMGAILLLVSAFLLPIARLLPLYTSTPRLVYFLAVFYALNGLAGAIDADPISRRWLLALIFAGAVCVLAWWGRPARLYRSAASDSHVRNDVVFVRWTLCLLVPVFATNVLGFLLFSYLLRLTLLLCSCFGLVLYTFVLVMTTLFTAILRLPRLRSLASVRLYEAGLVRWAGRVMKVTAAFCWTYVTLSLLGLQESTSRTLAAVLKAKPGVRAFDFSLGDFLGFLSVLTIGYFVARGCRFILREEILRRWRLSRGVPETVSTSLYYVLLLLVFLMSLNAAGIQLDKLTVLTGAFGVGLGFGMQNIVNNFVSGLILQYERPIRVGDILEVGTLSGEIRHIGIRASTMRTFQGAEVIIPNSTFISGQVVNWTLSEPVRRVDIPVRVAYGNDPERVIKLLRGLATRHADVLQEPEPCAVFMGFGESSLEFLLMFWAHQETHFRLRSEISIAINVTLREEGIEIPLPQREIHVHTGNALPVLRQSA